MSDWKNTLNLPRTGFPMKASLQTTEPVAIARWAAMGLYERIREQRSGAPKFVLHDGPPYANGRIRLEGDLIDSLSLAYVPDAKPTPLAPVHHYLKK